MLQGGYRSKKRVTERYKIVGFISSGTYGRVYKAVGRTGQKGEFAIKKFKPDKEGEVQYTGLSQSAIREMALCTELSHPNVIHTVEIILEDKCIFIVFEYAEHDLLQIIHHHTQSNRSAIPARSVKSILFQLLRGLLYLHQNWVMHRDLKPANIMVSSDGSVKIGDLGLARLFYKPLQSLFTGDKVVVTIWYRAPELLLGSRHYTPAVDLWAVGCIFAELLSLRPIFKGEEAKMDSKQKVPFQRNQMQKIVEIMGLPDKNRWPLLTAMPEYPQLNALAQGNPRINKPVGIENWYNATVNQNKYPIEPSGSSPGPEGLELLKGLLEYDPQKRLDALQALNHRYFNEGEKTSENIFEGSELKYPSRRCLKVHPIAPVSADQNTSSTSTEYDNSDSTDHETPQPMDLPAAIPTEPGPAAAMDIRTVVLTGLGAPMSLDRNTPQDDALHQATDPSDISPPFLPTPIPPTVVVAEELTLYPELFDDVMNDLGVEENEREEVWRRCSAGWFQ